MKNILFVKLVVTHGCRNYINITKYRVKKVTDKRVYYYSILDEDTTDEDVRYVDKEMFENCSIKSISDNAIISTIWCDEKDLYKAEYLVSHELEKYLTDLIFNIECCFMNYKKRSMIKIEAD